MIDDRLDDDEWALCARFVIETGAKRGRPPRDHRRVIDGVLWIALTGAAWRDLPPEFGNWSSVYRQFLRWSESGLWRVLLAEATCAERADLQAALTAVCALPGRRTPR
ncbi:transposase [Methylosinus sp. H3A]|uniref:transposase n=1 Tax=Methylosinus sp. H3A TaxID=2785786 RepID=UPI0018C29669|nr:transposase [Methylosinus sp. H3A]MBG0808379.1 transposase [Methylosinus sp. H3A]